MLGAVRVEVGEVGEDYIRNRATLLVAAEIRAMAAARDEALGG